MEMTFQAVVIQLLAGLSGGMIIFLIAVGLSLIFGTLKVLNLAHGSMYMLGAFVCFWLVSSFSGIPGIFWWTLIFAPVAVALFGGLVEVIILRRVYGWHIMYQYILTFGLILVISDICKLVWGREFHSILYPWPLQGSVTILEATFPVYNIFLIVTGVLIFFGLQALLRYTRLGMLIRGITYSREMVSALGENVPMIYTEVFMLGCWLGGFAGALVAPMATVCLGMDMAIIIQCFIVVVIGGVGSLPGAFIGAIIFGLLNAFGIVFIPPLAFTFGFMLMALILIIRPYGLMGRPE